MIRPATSTVTSLACAVAFVLTHVDNATSHVEEMAPFVALVAADPAFTTCLVPVGKGELLAAKTAS